MIYKFATTFAALALSVTTTVAGAVQPFPPDAGFGAGFSPNGGALDVVVSGIEAAHFSVLVAAYSFTSKPIALALLAAKRRGVRIAVIGDHAQNSRGYSAATFLANQGVLVRLTDRYSAAHNKFMVIDGEHVETGSLNCSGAAATKNAENVVLLWHVNRSPISILPSGNVFGGSART